MGFALAFLDCRGAGRVGREGPRVVGQTRELGRVLSLRPDAQPGLGERRTSYGRLPDPAEHLGTSADESGHFVAFVAASEHEADRRSAARSHRTQACGRCLKFRFDVFFAPGGRFDASPPPENARAVDDRLGLAPVDVGDQPVRSVRTGSVAADLGVPEKTRPVLSPTGIASVSVRHHRTQQNNQFTNSGECFAVGLLGNERLRTTILPSTFLKKQTFPHRAVQFALSFAA